MRLRLTSLFILLLASQLYGGFFSDLFESLTHQNRASEDVRVQEEPRQIERQEPVIQPQKVFEEDDTSSEADENEHTTSQRQLFLQYETYPKRLYLNQHFVIGLKAIVVANHIKKFQTHFLGGEGIKIINPNPQWKQIDDHTYQTKIYFKAINRQAKLPTIKVIAGNDENRYQEKIAPKPIKLIALKENPLFSHVIANDLQILSHKEKRYDNQSILVLMEINATLSNLEDFHLTSVQREALDDFEEHLTYQKVYYVSVVPRYQKIFKFKYFNLHTNRFHKVSFPIILEDATLSTQLGLNPKKSKFFLYKVIALLLLALFFALLYWRYKNFLFLILALLILGYTVVTKIFTPHITIPKGVNIRILPTHNSTVFFKTAKPLEAKVLLHKEGYRKIILPSGKIGWIKDDDLTKN